MSTLSPSFVAERRSILPVYSEYLTKFYRLSVRPRANIPFALSSLVESLETQNYKSGLANVQKALVRIKSGPNFHLLLVR
jgi:hypothetical protein